MKRPALLILLAALPLLLSIQEVVAREVTLPPEIIKKISDSISGEYVTCGAYYNLLLEDIARSGDIVGVEMTEYTRNAALEYALLIAKESRSQKTAEKEILVRFARNMKFLMAEMDYEIGNISILVKQYDSRCEEIMEYPDKMMGEWSYKFLKHYLLQ